MTAAHTAPRPTREHDHDCTGEDWQQQARILTSGRLMAYCAGCTAVTTIDRNTPRTGKPRR